MRGGGEEGEMREQILESAVLLLIAVLAISTASAQVTVSIGDIEASPGESITAPIMIYDVTDYGTGTIKVTYDPSVVHVTDVASTADSEVVAWSVDNKTGYVSISAWNLMGVSGDISFADVTFKAVGSPGDSSDLNIEIKTLKDTSYKDIPATPVNGSFKISIPTSPTPPPPAQIDLFFLIDGSGSIDAANFTLQLEGLAYAINDSTVIPQDGSVSVCVIQFSDYARLEIPRTIITNKSVADAVAAKILNITQIGGMTNMSGAFEVAIANLPSDLSGRQVIDLSTDGRPTAGYDPMIARDAALAAGFDEVNTMGVGEDIDETLLKNLAYPQPPDDAPGFYMYVENYQEFKEGIRDKIRMEIRPVAVPTMTPIGIAVLIGMLSVIATIAIMRKRKE